jgi:hypothetical protein
MSDYFYPSEEYLLLGMTTASLGLCFMKILRINTHKGALIVTTENSHTGLCARNSESNNVKAQNVHHGKLQCMCHLL